MEKFTESSENSWGKEYILILISTWISFFLHQNTLMFWLQFSKHFWSILTYPHRLFGFVLAYRYAFSNYISNRCDCHVGADIFTVIFWFGSAHFSKKRIPGSRNTFSVWFTTILRNTKSGILLTLIVWHMQKRNFPYCKPLKY